MKRWRRETGLVGDGLVPSRLEFRTGLAGVPSLAEFIGTFKTGDHKGRPYEALVEFVGAS